MVWFVVDTLAVLWLIQGNFYHNSSKNGESIKIRLCRSVLRGANLIIPVTGWLVIGVECLACSGWQSCCSFGWLEPHYLLHIKKLTIAQGNNRYRDVWSLMTVDWVLLVGQKRRRRRRTTTAIITFYRADGRTDERIGDCSAGTNDKSPFYKNFKFIVPFLLLQYTCSTLLCLEHGSRTLIVFNSPHS